MRTLLPYRLFVDSGQTVKVTRQGKMRSSWMMMIAGDQNGTIGFGIGKADAEEGDAARDRAWNNVKRNLLFVPLVESRTVLHPYTGRHGVCEIKIRPLPRGHGLTAGPMPRMIFDAVGIRDINANIYGRAIRKHQVFATFDALRNQSSIRELGIARGLNPYPLFDPGMHRYEPLTREQMREKYNDLQLRLMQLARTMGFDHELGRFVRNPAYHKEAAEEAKQTAENDPFRDYLNRDMTPLSHGYGNLPHPDPVPTNVGRGGRKI